MKAQPAGPLAARFDRPSGRSESAGDGLPLTDGSDRHHHAHGPGDVANDGNPSRTGTLPNSGTHPSGPHGGGCSWRKDGPQTQAIASTGHPCPEADRAGGTPRHGCAVAQRITANAISGVAGLTVTTFYRTGPVHGMWFEG